MITIIKKIASKLPLRYQQELKRLHFRHQIRHGRFRADEQEFDLLGSWIGQGDTVLDIGANIGHYTIRLSELVGPAGRVIAFEPVPATFELLSANSRLFAHENITLFNAAASDSTAFIGMSIPILESGLSNYYMANISEDVGALTVMCMPVDALNLSGSVSLIKIDAEGHEISVLRGMQQLLTHTAPVLIVEGNSQEVESFLEGLGYGFEKLERSPNRIYQKSRNLRSGT